VKKFRGWLVPKAHRCSYHSTLSSRAVNNKKKKASHPGGNPRNPLGRVVHAVHHLQGEGGQGEPPSGSVFRISGVVFRVSGSTLKIRSRVSGSGFLDSESGLSVKGRGLRVRCEAAQEATQGQMDFLSVNSHTNATRNGCHLWEIDLKSAPGLSPG